MEPIKYLEINKLNYKYKLKNIIVILCKRCSFLFIFTILATSITTSSTYADPLPDTIARVKPSVVGIGTIQKTRRPPAMIFGTGFVVADGLHVITNVHVVIKELKKRYKESLVVFVGNRKKTSVRSATIVATDKIHDLSLLKISGERIPAFQFGDDGKVREGELYAFSGYPLGGALGLHVVTHRGIISAATPIIIPVVHAGKVKGARVNHLQKPFIVFQLDATAYPGNSGSPLYDIENGRVIGIVNSVFVKRSKENAIKDPSGITYAIPVRHARKLLLDAGLQ